MRSAVLAMVAALLVSGCGAAATGAPSCVPTGASATSAPTVSAVPTPSRAKPTSMDIPTIGFYTGLIPVGRSPDGGLIAPPMTQSTKAGWYSARLPGEPGAAVITGHVERLDDLVLGDEIGLMREDGTRVLFRVYAFERYAVDKVDTDKIFEQTKKPELRVITGTGDFDRETGSYPDTLVAFASLAR